MPEETIIVPETTGTEPNGTELVIPEEPANNNKVEEDVIIFEDAPAKKSDDANDSFILEEDKKSMKALEDEYYELEGF